MQGSTGGRQGARVQDVGGRRGVVLAASALTAVAVLGAGGVAAVTGAPATPTTPSASPSSSPAATPPVTTPPALVRETVQATRLHAARGDAFFEHATLVRDPAALTIVKDVGERLDPQEAAALLVVLPLARAAPDCVRSASLTLDVAATAGSPAEVGVYPGAATSLVDGGVPASDERSAASLVDNRPRGVATVSGPGPVEVDVTELARTWTAGGPFPSTGRRVEPGTPLLLVLRPTAADPGRWTVTLAGPPTLTYGSEPGCTGD